MPYDTIEKMLRRFFFRNSFTFPFKSELQKIIDLIASSNGVTRVEREKNE